MEDIQNRIRKYIVTDIMFKKDESELNFDDPLLEKGIIDSVGLVNLAAFLEEEFKITISHTEMMQENFETVNAISDLVKRITSNGDA